MTDRSPSISTLPDGLVPDAVAPPSFAQALRFWFKLGCISFGGPAGQLAIMHRELVQERRWISEGRYLHALNYCMLLPGPEAQQMATYMGWLMHGVRGGLAAGGLFVLPSLFILILLSWGYMAYGHLGWVAGIFAGLKPAVAALVIQAVHRLGARVLKTPALWAVAVAAFVAMTWGEVPFPWIVLLAALVGALGARGWPQAWGALPAAAKQGQGGAADAPLSTSPRAWIDDESPAPPHTRPSRSRLLRSLAWGLGLWGLSLGALLLWQGWSATLTQMGWFFTKAALMTFGGAYAVLPYVHQGAVEQHHWLSAAQMMDGLALGETTPGPLIMVVAFVAFVGGWSQQLAGPDALWLGGCLAAVVVTWFTFLPSFVFIFAGAPLIEATHGQVRVSAPLSVITAAVVGVVLQLALFFCVHALWPQGVEQGLDVGAGLIGALAALALMRFKLPVLPVLLGAAALGLMGQLLTWPI